MPYAPYIRGAVNPTAPFVQYGAKPAAPAGTPYVSKRDQVNKLLSNYNDPLEINSLADVIMNSAGRKANGLNMLTAGADLLWRRTILPIANGRWDIAGLNLLTNLGETLDVVANPIKALVKEGIAAVPSALGIGAQGRRNFDMDTGNLVADIGLEILLDPLNWVSLGGKAAASAAVKSAIRPIAQEVLSETGEGVAKRVLKVATREFLDSGDWTKAVTDAASKIRVAKLPNPAAFDKSVIDTLAQRTSEVAARTILPAVQKMVKMGDTFEKGLMQATMMSSGYGLGWWVAKHGYSMVAQSLAHRAVDVTKVYQNDIGGLAMGTMEEARQAFEQLGTLTQQAGAAEHLDSDVFQVLMSNAAHTLSARIDDLSTTVEDLPELQGKLDSLARGERTTDFAHLVQTVIWLDETHRGAFSALRAQLEELQGYLKYGVPQSVKEAMDDKNLAYVDMALNQLEIYDPKAAPKSWLRYDVERAADLGSGRYDWDQLGEMSDDKMAEVFRASLKPQWEQALETLAAGLDKIDPTRVADRMRITAYVDEFFEDVLAGMVLEAKTVLSNPNHPAWKQIIADQPYVLTALRWKRIYSAYHEKISGLAKDMVEYYESHKTTYMQKLSMEHIRMKKLDRVLKSGSKPLMTANAPGIEQLRSAKRVNTDDVESAIKSLELMAAESGRSVQQYCMDLLTQVFAKAPDNNLLEDMATDFSALVRDAFGWMDDPKAKAHHVHLSTKIELLLALQGMLKRAPAMEDLLPQNVKALDLKTWEPVFIQVDSREVYYKLKYAQLNSLLHLVTDDATRTGLLTLAARTATEGEILQNLTTSLNKQIAEAAQIAQDQLAGYQAFLRFTSRLNRAGMDERIRLAVMDTLMWYQREDPGEFLTHFDRYLAEIYEKTETQMYALRQTRELGLDNLVESEEYLASFRNGQAHTAKQDVEVLRSIIEHELPDELYKDDRYIDVVLDCETQGFNAATDAVYELAFAIGQNGPMVELLAKTDRIPAAEFLRKSGHTRASFMAKVAGHTLTEQELLTDFVRRLLELQATGKQVRLVAHNGESFDFAFLWERIRLASQTNEELKELTQQLPLNQLETVDTLRLLRKKHGFSALSADAKRIIRDQVWQYAKTIGETKGVQLFQPVSYALAHSLSVIGEYLSKDLGGGQAETVFGQMIRATANNLFASMHHITEVNGALSTLFVRKTYLENEGTNIARFLSDGKTAFNQYAGRISVSFPELLEWFDPGSDIIRLDLAQKMTGIAHRILAKMRKNIKRVYPIAPYEAQIDALLGLIKQRVSPRSPLSYLRIPPNLPDKWVLLQYAWKQAELPELADMPEVKRLLESPTPLYDRTVSEGKFSYTESFDNLDFGEESLDQDILELAQEELAHDERIAALDEMLYVKDHYRARGQAYSLRRGYTRNALVEETQFIRDELFGKSYALRREYLNKLTGLVQDTRREQTKELVLMAPEDFVRHLYHNAKGVIAFDPMDMADDTQFLEDLQGFLARKIPGVSIHTEKNLVVAWLNGDAVLEELAPIATKELYLNAALTKLENAPLVEHIKAVRSSMGSRIHGTAGELMGSASFKTLLERLPEQVQKTLHPKLTVDLVNDAGVYMGFGFNHSVLGTTGRSKLLPALSNNLLRLQNQAVQFTRLTQETRDLYAEMILHPALGINTSPLFKDLSDQELLDILKAAPEYRLIALVEDDKILLPNGEKQGYRVINIKPGNLRSIQLARERNAVIVPMQTYSKMAESINRFEHKGVLGLWHRLIYVYKVGYLGSIGTLARNLMDTMTKNAAGGVNLNTQWNAISLYNRYMDHTRKILAFSENRFNPKTVAEYFQQEGLNMTELEYQMVHDACADGPMSMSEDLQRYFIEKGLAKQGEMSQEKTGIWAGFVQLSQMIMKPNGYIEQVARLAQYIHELDMGATPTHAFYEIAKTHFDYATKTDVERYIELVIPFYTFTMRNLEYWADAMASKPWLMGLLRDVMTPVWNLDGEDPDEYRYNRSVQYRILAGNAEIKDNGLVLKLGPSFMDAFNLLTQPLEAATGRMAAPLQLPLKAATGEAFNWDEQLPIVGTWLQRGRSALRNLERTDGDPLTLMPSLFGAVKHWDGYTKKGRRYYVRKPPRVRKPYRGRRYVARKFKARPIRKTYWTRIWPKLMWPQRWRNPRNIYRDQYTSTGKSRISQSMIPVTAATLKYRIRFTNPQFFLR